MLNFNEVEDQEGIICSLHFKQEDFLKQFGKTLVKATAVPTLAMDPEQDEW